MPIVHPSSWPGARFGQFNGHLQTLIPGLRRRITGVTYVRERISTSDGDFLDLDWIRKGNRRLVILTHGLEGNSGRHYMQGSAKLFNRHHWDALAWNCRSCSGEMNRAFRLYHHGDIDDIHRVVQYALATGQYDQIAMVGYSMGGNITMKYVGTQGENIAPQICAAVAFSSPCDLKSASEILNRRSNTVYRVFFLRALRKKIREKALQYPGKLDIEQLKKVRQWRDFDEWFSAPICGFKDAADFYRNASARNFIEGIRVPTLLVNALNDPILTPECMPVELAEKSPWFYLEMPAGGGHCGFQTRKRQEFTWAETRSLEFCESRISNR
ncbi:MAG: alpha/beta fold hydrolase [Bacteroidota bacterium]